MRYVLRKQHVNMSVPVQITETHVTASSEFWRRESLPELRFRILRAQTGQLRFAGADPQFDVTNRVIGRLNAKVLEPRGAGRRYAGLSLQNLGIRSFKDQPAVDKATHAWAVALDLQTVIVFGVVGEGNAGELAEIRHPKLSLERQVQRQTRFAVIQREQVVVPVRVIAEHDTR